MSKALLITGATGKQGGSLINALLQSKAGFEILAVTRNTESPSAQRLLKKSPQIKLLSGNLNDAQQIFKQAKKVSTTPIWGVFSVQVAIGDGANAESEERQGKALVDAAIENNVKHFVYSSVDRGGDRTDQGPTDVPHFKSKYEIEQHLFQKTRNNEMNWTVLRPVAFFENLVPGFMGKTFATAWEVTLKKSQKLQLIATSDIGFFAAEAFSKPQEYQGRAISLAGDELTYDQFKSVFKQKTGQELPTTYHFIAHILLWLVKDLGYMYRWFRDVGYGVEISPLKKINPGTKDFGEWLEKDSQFKTR